MKKTIKIILPNDISEELRYNLEISRKNINEIGFEDNFYSFESDYSEPLSLKNLELIINNFRSLDKIIEDFPLIIVLQNIEMEDRDIELFQKKYYLEYLRENEMFLFEKIQNL